MGMAHYCQSKFIHDLVDSVNTVSPIWIIIQAYQPALSRRIWQSLGIPMVIKFNNLNNYNISIAIFQVYIWELCVQVLWQNPYIFWPNSYSLTKIFTKSRVLIWSNQISVLARPPRHYTRRVAHNEWARGEGQVRRAAEARGARRAARNQQGEGWGWCKARRMVRCA